MALDPPGTSPPAVDMPASPPVGSARDDSNAITLFQEDDDNDALTLVQDGSNAIVVLPKTLKRSSTTQEDGTTDKKALIQDCSNAIVLRPLTQFSKALTTQEDATMGMKEREIYERDDGRCRASKRTRRPTPLQPFFTIASPPSLFDAAPPSLPDDADLSI
jgi:hypothetical protein